MTIASRLDEAMRGGDGREEVSQSELFRRSTVPQPTIARILKGRGKSGPESDTLIKLANALGIEFMWLQQGLGPKYVGQSATPSRADIVAVPIREPAFKRHWLSEDEADHLADYRSLTDRSRNQIRSITKSKSRDKADLERGSTSPDEF